MWTAVGVLLLVLAGILLIIALAFLAPVRLGFELRAADRLSEATGGVRLYGGLLGVGARVRRGSHEHPLPMTITVGLLFCRKYWPLRRIRRKEEASPPPPGRSEPVEPPQRREKAHPPAAEPPSAAHETPEERQAPAASTPGAPPARQPRQATAEKTSREEKPEPAMGAETSPITPERLRRIWDEWGPLIAGAYHRLRGVLRLRRMRIEGTLGTGDPALTGQAVGLASAARGFEGRAFRIRVEPDFDRRTAHGVLSVEWRLSFRRIWSAGLYLGWALFKRRRAAARLRKTAERT